MPVEPKQPLRSQLTDIAYMGAAIEKSITDIAYSRFDCAQLSVRYGSIMGRPPLGVKSTVVRLPQGLGERIDALVGKQKRASFIREAVEKEVTRLEKSRAG